MINYGSKQWQIYIEAKEAVLGGPRTQGAPQVQKKGCRITIVRNAFNKIIDIVGVCGGWGPAITVAWGLTRPIFGPGSKDTYGI